MSTKERREREKLALREAILNAARAIAADEGWSAVTIRRIADRIEYSPPIIYEYFDDKDSLLVALLVDGFRQLRLSIQTARASAPDPEAALEAIMNVYWRFAQDSPELYQVMNSLGGVSFKDIDKTNKPAELQATADEVRDAISTWASAQGIVMDDLEAQLHILWGTMHGLVALGMAGRISGDADYIHRLLQQALHTILRGWQNQ